MTLEQIQRQRQAVETVHDIVGAMRSIAAGRIQHAQRALQGARRYHEIVLQAAATLIAETGFSPSPPAELGPLGLVVMTSEQPLCGSFNQEVLALAERRWREIGETGRAVRLVVVGQRGLRGLSARGIPLDGTEPAATSLPGVREMVRRLAAALGERYSTGEVVSVRVIYSRYESISEQVPTEEQLLPPDFSALRQAVTQSAQPHYRYLSRSALFAGLVAEYAFVSLYRVAAESFASEQASRLLAMDAATRNTERLLEELTDLERRERQGEITRQVLELVAARFASGPWSQSAED